MRQIHDGRFKSGLKYLYTYAYLCMRVGKRLQCSGMSKAPSRLPCATGPNLPDLDLSHFCPTTMVEGIF